MSAPGGAPSPGPRGGSMGPNANGTGMGMPSQGSLPGTPVHSAPTPGPSAPPSGAMSQQNLNQIVSSARRPSFPLCDVLFYPCPLCPIFALRFFISHGGDLPKLRGFDMRTVSHEDHDGPQSHQLQPACGYLQPTTTWGFPSMTTT